MSDSGRGGRVSDPSGSVRQAARRHIGALVPDDDLARAVRSRVHSEHQTTTNIHQGLHEQTFPKSAPQVTALEEEPHGLAPTIACNRGDTILAQRLSGRNQRWNTSSFRRW